jgi:hypothetical protein
MECAQSQNIQSRVGIEEAAISEVGRGHLYHKLVNLL